MRKPVVQVQQQQVASSGFAELRILGLSLYENVKGFVRRLLPHERNEKFPITTEKRGSTGDVRVHIPLALADITAPSAPSVDMVRYSARWSETFENELRGLPRRFSLRRLVDVVWAATTGWFIPKDPVLRIFAEQKGFFVTVDGYPALITRVLYATEYYAEAFGREAPVSGLIGRVMASVLEMVPRPALQHALGIDGNGQHVDLVLNAAIADEARWWLSRLRHPTHEPLIARGREGMVSFFWGSEGEVMVFPCQVQDYTPDGYVHILYVGQRPDWLSGAHAVVEPVMLNPEHFGYRTADDGELQTLKEKLSR